ncbi:hypothetical protein NL676_013729 [Syzygium grande]|nr:hypothetical protein NL676_013729 [Syzygium grande]
MGRVGSGQCRCYNAKTSSRSVFVRRDTPFSCLKGLWTGRLPSTALRFSKQDLADEALYYGVDSRLRSTMSPLPSPASTPPS